MQNKKIINKLKDNAELAWAAYGYFHLANESYKPEENSKDWKRLEEFRRLKAKELGRYLDENLPHPCRHSQHRIQIFQR